MIDTDYQADPMLTIKDYPGHTPGSIAINLKDGGEQACFSGDVMHVPMQIHYPRWGTSLDDDPHLGIESRLRLLERCAETRTLMLPTHFVPSGGCFIARAGDGFAPEWNEAVA